MQREHWHLTEGLIFAHFAVFILSATIPGGQQALALIPGLVGARPWTLVTYQFVHGNSMFWFFISMLVLWIMARPIEESWGSPRFMVFWLVSTFGASLTAAALGRPLYGDVGFSTCLLFTFATLYPEVEFRLFFIIPVKVKYLAVIAAAILVYSSLSYGIVGGLANIAGVSSGYLFFLAIKSLLNIMFIEGFWFSSIFWLCFLFLCFGFFLFGFLFQLFFDFTHFCFLNY